MADEYPVFKNAEAVITWFKKTYPGKNIVALPAGGPAEIICEIDPTAQHPEVNMAVAAIKQSAPHYHKKAVEEYEVLAGKLTVFVDKDIRQLEKGQRVEIRPGQVHYAKGEWVLIKVTSRPGWLPEDHFLV
jgi:quercetin dioxygenase-like cupin family protein